MNTLETNKLIAEFMGAKFHEETPFLNDSPNHLWLPFHGIVNYKSIETGFGRRIRYHDSWDWLMPVVEKIESLVFDQDIFYNFIISGGCQVYIINSHTEELVDTSKGTKILSVYDAVVKFIQWYNENKKSHE